MGKHTGVTTIPHRLAKICSLLPFAIIPLGVIAFILGILNYLYFWIPSDIADYIFGAICVLGWIPSLISSVLGIVFSSLMLKEHEDEAENFLTRSFVACVLSVFWGAFVIF